MTYTVSGGALNSTQSNTYLLVIVVVDIVMNEILMICPRWKRGHLMCWCTLVRGWVELQSTTSQYNWTALCPLHNIKRRSLYLTTRSLTTLTTTSGHMSEMYSNSRSLHYSLLLSSYLLTHSITYAICYWKISTCTSTFVHKCSCTNVHPIYTEPVLNNRDVYFQSTHVHSALRFAGVYWGFAYSSTYLHRKKGTALICRIFVYKCTCTNVLVQMYVHKCTCTNVDIFNSMHICTCTNVHVQMYICTCTFVMDYTITDYTITLCSRRDSMVMTWHLAVI